MDEEREHSHMKFPWKKDRELTAVRSADDNVERVQLWCLVAVAVMELIFLVAEGRGSGFAWLYIRCYLTVPAMIFLGASLTRRIDRGDRLIFLLSMGMLVWFVVTQTVHRIQDMDNKELGVMFCTYGICLPFAALARDGQRQRGLKCIAAVVIGVGTLLTGYAVLLVLNLRPDFFKDYVFWTENRFLALGHPNLCAAMLMLSMAICMGFFFQTRRRWVKAALLVLAVAQFAALSLTNGRTTLVFACVLMGGIVFCALRGHGWKRKALALLAALILMVGMFAGAQKIVEANKDRLESAAETEYIQNQDGTGQGTWDHDMRTLNGRTYIWSAALEGLRNNPSIRIFGTEYTDLIISQYNPFPVLHGHNSWVQVLYEMGFPGLLLALAITLLAVRGALTQLWRNTDLWKSCIAMLVLCLLGCGMLEPYLFTLNPGNHYFDIVFMLCTGYLECWRREGRENTADCP